MLKKRKTLRFQSHATIALTFAFIAVIYSLILYPFENRRRATVIKKIEFSLNAIVEQREEVIANEMFLHHQEALEIILKNMLEIEGVLAIGVFDADGNVITATEKHVFLNLTVSEREALSETYTFVETVWNQQHIVAYTRPIIVIGEHLGYLRLYYTLTDVDQETRQVFILFTALLVTILASMTILLTMFLSRFVTRPVTTLMNTMRKVQEGHVGEQVDLLSDNEIGKMAQAFNQMSAEQAKMYWELNELNKNLEQIVKERTAELTTANQHLQQEIAERKRAEEALQHAKEAAEEANQAKSEFLSNMSHELRTPLNGILGYTQILKRDKKLTPKQKENLHIIHQSGEHLLTLIEDILDLSKIEARKMELYPHEFHLPNFLGNIARTIQMRAQEKALVFTYEARTSIPAGVYADEKRLRQVLLNLLGNAIKFTDEGEVTFRIVDCRLQIADLEDCQSKIKNLKSKIHKLRFEVEDTGVGMSPSQVQRLFQPFHQVGDTQRRATGTGLGLAISQQLVRLMGSEIKVKSDLGKGSTFWFELQLPEVSPLALEEEKENRQQHIIGFKGAPRRLLLVDDNPENLAVVKDMLLPLGFNIIEAVDGQDAINKALEYHPDLIIMDLIMPNMDGFEVIQRLRQILELQDVIVIAASADVFEYTQQKSRTAGSNGFIVKPIKAEKLLELLEHHLKLEWIYEDEGEVQDTQKTIEPYEIIFPEQKDLAALYDLAMIGDISGIREYAKKLEVLDPKFTPFVTKICQLVDELRLDQIENFLESHISK